MRGRRRVCRKISKTKFQIETTKLKFSLTYLNVCPGTGKEIWGSRTPSSVGRPTLYVKRTKTSHKFTSLVLNLTRETHKSTPPCHIGESQPDLERNGVTEAPRSFEKKSSLWVATSLSLECSERLNALGGKSAEYVFLFMKLM